MVLNANKVCRTQNQDIHVVYDTAAATSTTSLRTAPGQQMPAGRQTHLWGLGVADDHCTKLLTHGKCIQGILICYLVLALYLCHAHPSPSAYA